MNENRILNSIYTGALLGFIVASVKSTLDLSASGYITYRMPHLVLNTLQKNFDMWVAVISFSAVIIFFLWWSVFSVKNILTKKISFLKKNSVRFPIAALAGTIFAIALRYVVFSIFFTASEWLPNRVYSFNVMMNIFILSCGLTVFSAVAFATPQRIPKKIKITGMLAIIFVVLFDIGITAEKNLNHPEGPNVIFIGVDTLRADFLGCYNPDKKGISPSIDKLAADSILYKNAYSHAPWTSPSVASIFASRYPSEMGFASDMIVFDDKLLTLSELLKEHNYKTTGIISNYMISEAMGYDQGFDIYNEDHAKEKNYISSPGITEQAVRFLKANKNKKFFLFLFYTDPHYDYFMHNDFNYFPDYKGPLYSGEPITEMRKDIINATAQDKKFLSSLYESEISYTDKYIGLVIDELKKLGLYENSLIVFTADHGEEFAQRGDNWIGHTKRLYQELIHMPLMIKQAGTKKSGSVDTNVSLMDIYPTIAAYTGIKIPEKYMIRGMPLPDTDETTKERFIISETKRWADLQAVILNNWKLIYDLNKKTSRLFDLRRDPKEAHDIAGTNKLLIDMFLERLARWDKEMKDSRASINAKKADISKEKLKSLGYLQ